MAIRIPTRFEMLLNKSGIDPSPLIVPVESDLQAFEKLRRTMDVQQGGALAFTFAESGAGKTTSVYSLAALLSDRYQAVFPVPTTVPLRDLGAWLNSNLPDPQARKALPVLFDGREATDDEVGLRQLMSGLNAIVRARPDVMMIWPTTEEEWRKQLRTVAHSIGGRTLVPSDGDISISGPQKSAWNDVLDRLLVQLDQSREDLALSDESIADCADGADTVGAFLEGIRDLVSSRLDQVQIARSLPTLLFVISSDVQVVGEANRLRRARHLYVKADEMLAYSRRSDAGKYWKARMADPNHHLAYITTLFQARLVTMGPSTVAHAAMEYGDHALSDLAEKAGASKNSGNAGRTFKSTDFYKFLSGQTEFELTSSTKGSLSDPMKKEYAAIQSVSSKRHKAINMSICSLAQKHVPEFRAEAGKFEVDLGAANAFADAVISHNENEYHLEFHHLSEAHCTAASMSSYIMAKLQTYALHYNLIPR